MATVADNLQTIIDIKGDIKNAIEAKGVLVGDASFGSYANKIGEISGGTATILPDGIKFKDSTCTSFPELQFDNLTSCYEMFYMCSNLTTVPLFDTSKVTNMEGMFSNCDNLTHVPLFNTSNVTNMDDMLHSCVLLTELPQFDTSNVTSMRYFCQNCYALESFPEINTSKVTNMNYMCAYCYALTTVPALNASKVSTLNNVFYYCSSLTDFGGFINLGQGFSGATTSFSLAHSNLLTHNSCMNIINNLYDMNLKFSVPANKVTFHPDVYALLSADDIAIATEKGWTIAS